MNEIHRALSHEAYEAQQRKRQEEEMRPLYFLLLVGGVGVAYMVLRSLYGLLRDIYGLLREMRWGFSLPLTPSATPPEEQGQDGDQEQEAPG
jgi:hypothetical protein